MRKAGALKRWILIGLCIILTGFMPALVWADTEEDWALILANKQNPIPEGYEPKLVFVDSSHEVDWRIADPLSNMIEAAKKDGVSLVVSSAYRSYDRQVELFRKKINSYMKAGQSYYDAYKSASYSVTVPGMSEHQLGLAIDFVTPGYTNLDSGFGKTEAGKWLKKHAPEYGFILRYPEGKGYITGIIFEPWHFRYVGKKAALEITKEGLTLEEYTGHLD